jgi:hypothetical protein
MHILHKPSLYYSTQEVRVYSVDITIFILLVDLALQ